MVQFVDRVQKAVNSTYTRSTGSTPFELLVGTKTRSKEDHEISKLVQDEIVNNFNNEREIMRKQAKEQILKVQDENRKSYNLRRKPATKYKEGDVVAVKRTQFGGGLKLKSKFLGPYHVTKIKPNNTYDVSRIGEGEGSKQTTTCAEYMEPLPKSGTIDDTFEANA